MNLSIKAGLIICLGGLAWSTFTPSVLAGRYVLNQTPQTIQKYFGKPLKVEATNNPNQQIYTYSVIPLRQVLPSLPKGATFGMTFVNNRVSDIWLSANATPPNETFSFGQPQAFKLYRYLFGYNPPLWKKIDLPFGGGGHEGFVDNKYCLGDGVGTTFMSYMLGEENIRLFYDPICERSSTP